MRPRVPPALLVLVLLVPLLPVAPAQSADADQHHLNVNQPVALPGSTVGFTVSGRVGEVEVRVFRLLHPEALRAVAKPDQLPREQVLERTVRLSPQGGWGPDAWGSAQEVVMLEKPGVYVLETTRGSVTRHAWLQVATHSFLVKDGPSRAILHAFRLRDGEPLAGARVVVNGTEAGLTGPDGVLPLDVRRLDGPVVVLAPEGTAAVGVLGLERYWGGDQERVRVLAHFDRPIYRPGQTVHLKALTFEAEGERYVPFNASAVRVRVTTFARGGEQVVHESTLASNAWGSVALSLPLPEDAPLGHYSVALTTAGGAHGWASFQVEAYRKPRFEVEAEPARDAYVQGEEVVVRASASWFFGSPLRRGEVEWRATATPDYAYGCWSCDYLLHREAPWAMPPEVTGRGQLSAEGTYAFSVPAPPASQPLRMTIHVAVTAESGERQEDRVEVTVHPASYRVEVSADRWAYAKGTPVLVTAQARHLDGAPAAGVPVALALREERGDAVRTQTVLSDGAGRATAVFDAPRGGGYAVTATVRDAAGRETHARHWVWVTEERVPWSGEQPLALVPERQDYAVGETARVLVLSSRPAHVLVTLEGADLFAWQVVRVDGGRFVEFPLKGAHAPSVTVAAFGVRMEGGSHYGPETFGQEAYLHVGPDPRALNVTITPDRPAYRDGDETRLLVQVRDAEGRPVEGELSLGVVDESIYRLAQGDGRRMVEHLYPGARNVRTTHAWNTLQQAVWVLDSFGGRGILTGFSATAEASMDLGRKDFGDGWDASESSLSQVEVKVREDFPDTALWLPFLRTGPDGTARVRLAAPDTLTEWRVTGRAHTLGGLVGDGTASFHTRKPLMVDLATPRFFVQGDALNVTVVVFNHVGEMRDVEVQLMGEGALRLDGSGYRRVTLSDGDSVRLDFPVVATDDPSALANLTVVAVTRGATDETDAMRLRLPVLPHGVVEKASRAGVDDATFTLAVPPGPYATPPVLTLTLAPTMGATVLDALPYLLGFPYGCVEQTMSRFMPAVVATRALQDAGYDAKHPDLPKYVEGGLERLARFQHADGGWGWWEGDATHPYMTAYVVIGLAEAKRAGVPFEAKMLERGVDSLGGQYGRATEPDMRAYMAYALALAGSPPAAWPDERGMSADGLALLGLAKLASGDRAGARALLDALMDKAVRGEGRMHWASGGDQWGSHGIRSDVQLTSHVLRLMVGLGRDDEAHQVVAWLAAKRIGAGWATTKDTSESVLAMIDYLRSARELSPEFDAAVRVGDQTFRVPFHGPAKDLERRVIEVPLDASREGGEITVSVAREGPGRLYWSALLASVPHRASIPAADHGIRVAKGIVDDKGVPATRLAFGQEYVVTLTVATPEERGHVLLHDPLPAGVEVVKDPPAGHGDPYYGGMPWMRGLVCWQCGGWTWPWSNVEVRDDHVAAFATTLPAGESTLSYRIRAVNPGSYHVLPTTVEEMYAPEIHGRSGDLHVAVGDVPRLLLGDALVQTAQVTLRVIPAGGQALRVESLQAAVLDDEGKPLALARAPEVVLLEDGSANVTLATELPLPVSFAVSLGVPQEPPAVRVFRLDGAPARFDGGFPEPLAAAWAAGPVVEAAAAPTRSDRTADFGDVPPPIRPDQPPRPVQPPPRGPIEERGVPAPGPAALLVAVAAVALVAGAAGRRKR